MENRNTGIKDQKELGLQHRAAIRQAATNEIDDAPLSREELHRLIEFFRLLDHWDRQEVVQ